MKEQNNKMKLLKKMSKNKLSKSFHSALHVSNRDLKQKLGNV
jgi:hypothetical protein